MGGPHRGLPDALGARVAAVMLLLFWGRSWARRGSAGAGGDGERAWGRRGVVALWEIPITQFGCVLFGSLWDFFFEIFIKNLVCLFVCFTSITLDLTTSR